MLPAGLSVPWLGGGFEELALPPSIAEERATAAADANASAATLLPLPVGQVRLVIGGKKDAFFSLCVVFVSFSLLALCLLSAFSLVLCSLFKFYCYSHYSCSARTNA